MVELRNSPPVRRPSSTERGDTIRELDRGPIPEAISRLPTGGIIGPLARKAILTGVGMARSPGTHLAVRGMLSNFFFTSPDTAKSLGERTMELVDAIDQAASLNTPADQFVTKVGEIAPEMVVAFSGFGIGRAAGVGALRAGANAFPKGKIATGVRAKAAEAVTDFPVATPRIQQLAEIVGGNVGFGVTETLLSREAGASRGEALTRGAVATGLGLGLETVGRGIGKLVLRGRELRASPEFPEATKKDLKKRLRDVRSEIRQTNKRINEVNETFKQQVALEEMASGAAVLRQQMKKGAVPFVPKTTQDAIAEQLKDVVRPGTVAKKLRRTVSKGRTAARNKLAQTSKRLALEDLLEPNPSLLSFVRPQPIGMNKPPSIRAMLRFWHGLFSTPAGLAPKLGPSGFKMFQLLDMVSVDSLIGRARWSKRVSELREMANPEQRLVRAAFDLYEAPGGSVQAVTDKFGPLMGRVVQAVRQDFESLNKQIVAVGGQPALTAEEMAKLKVGNFLAQVHKQVDEGSYIETGAKAMARETGMNIESARARMMTIAKNRQIGPRRFGGIDFQRGVPGTTRSKVQSGVALIDDPFEALFVHAQEVEHRLALSKNLGFNAGVIEQLIETAGKEGADTTMLRNMAEHMLGHNYHDRWMNSFARVATNWEAFTKMTYAIIPNAFQPIANNPLMFGAKASGKGMALALSKENPVDIEIALGLMDPYLVQLQRSFQFGERRLGITGVLANFALIPFQKVERWNRWITGNMAYSGIMQILARAEAGALRGRTLDQARRTMLDAGMDLTLIARQGPTEWLRENPDALLRAIFKLTQRTQFIPTASIRPVFWSHPFMRVASQFMTFALNQGRLMKDIVIGEMGRGNFGPMAYVLAVHPIIGEVTLDLQAIVKGKMRTQDSLLGRVLEDFSAVGSFGMGKALLSNAQFSAARLGISAFTGPFFSDVSETIENAASGNFGGIVRQVVDLPVVDAAIKLFALGNFAFEELEAGILGTLGEQLGTPAEPEDEAVPTLQELQRRQKEQQP